MPRTSSTSTRWRCSSPSARRPSIRGSRSSSRPSWPGTRGAEDAHPGRGDRRPRRPRSRPACARPSPGWASARSPRTSAGRSSTSSISTRRSSRAASRRPRRGRAGRPSTTWPLGSSDAPRASAAIAPTGTRPRAAPPGPRVRPLPRRRRGAPVLAEDRRESSPRSRPTGDPGVDVDAALARYRDALARGPADRAVPRDELRVRRPSRPTALVDVEDARDIVRRFVVSAMSVGALSPEAHQALTIGIQRAGGAANTGEGGEDPGLVHARAGRPPPRRADQAGRIGAVRRHRDVPRPRRPARDQDRPGLEARRGRPAARSQGDRLHRRAPPRPARPELHQPAAAPRHLLDRGPRPAHRRPAGDQPGRPDRRQARRRRAASGRSPRASPRPAPRTSTCPATPAGPARRRCPRSSTSARRGSSGSPRSTRSCSATTCATASRCAPTAASRPGATCSSRRCSAPRSSRSGPRRSSRSAATWPASATSTPARPASPPSARTCARSSPARPRTSCASRSPSPRTSGASWRRSARAPSARSSARAARLLTPLARGPRRARAGHRRRAVGRLGRAPRPIPRAPAASVRYGHRRRSLEAGHRDRVPRPGIRDGRRPARDHGRSLVRGRAHRAPSSAATCAARSTSSCAARRASRSGRSPGPGIELRLVGQANDYVGKGLSGGSVDDRPGAGPRRDAARARRSPATPCLYGATGGRLHLVGRAGMRFAVRNSRRRGRRRGHRPARLRVHDRRRRRRPRPGRGELRRRDDRRPCVPVRPGRPTRRGPRRSAASRPCASPPSSPTARTARHASPSSSACSRRTGTPVPRSPRGSSTDADLAADVWVVEPIAPPAPPVIASARADRPCPRGHPDRARPTGRVGASSASAAARSAGTNRPVRAAYRCVGCRPWTRRRYRLLDEPDRRSPRRPRTQISIAPARTFGTISASPSRR